MWMVKEVAEEPLYEQEWIRNSTCVSARIHRADRAVPAEVRDVIAFIYPHIRDSLDSSPISSNNTRRKSKEQRKCRNKLDFLRAARAAAARRRVRAEAG